MIERNKEQAVLVTTSYRGVFFGYATEIDGDIIELKRARLDQASSWRFSLVSGWASSVLA